MWQRRLEAARADAEGKAAAAEEEADAARQDASAAAQQLQDMRSVAAKQRQVGHQ